jgi:hypothetical protein
MRARHEAASYASYSNAMTLAMHLHSITAM